MRGVGKFTTGFFGLHCLSPCVVVRSWPKLSPFLHGRVGLSLGYPVTAFWGGPHRGLIKIMVKTQLIGCGTWIVSRPWKVQVFQHSDYFASRGVPEHPQDHPRLKQQAVKRVFVVWSGMTWCCVRNCIISCIHRANWTLHSWDDLMYCHRENVLYSIIMIPSLRLIFLWYYSHPVAISSRFWLWLKKTSSGYGITSFLFSIYF